MPLDGLPCNGAGEPRPAFQLLIKGQAMKLGDTRVQEVKSRTCEVCGEPATRKCTYLLENYRSNPASSGYRRDDCTWCQDAEKFACLKHVDDVRRDAPRGMGQASVFYRERFEEMFLYWDVQD